MKVNVKVTFDIIFDSDDGASKTTVSFELPEHPKLSISGNVKKLSVEETERLCRAMLERNVFQENVERMHPYQRGRTSITELVL